MIWKIQKNSKFQYLSESYTMWDGQSFLSPKMLTFAIFSIFKRNKILYLEKYTYLKKWYIFFKILKYEINFSYYEIPKKMILWILLFFKNPKKTQIP